LSDQPPFNPPREMALLVDEPAGAADSSPHPIRQFAYLSPSELLNSRETGFEAFYCEPGVAGAHEKGGVEGEIGRYRRRWFVPVPQVRSLAELNARLAEDDIEDARRHIELRTATVAQDFAAEQPSLRPLPGDGFDTGTVLWPRADKFARISVGKCRYSVPARLIGVRVRIRLTANELEVYDKSQLVAVHPRLVSSGAEHLDLDHYLEILLRKPGAMPGSVPLKQARAAGTFTPAHQRLWDAARARLGDGPGTRVLIEVLLLHRRLPAGSVTAGITAALGAGSCSPDVIALEARKHAAAAGAAAGRAAPSVAAYDQLLDRPSAGRQGGGT
jgi:hypothetical protein